MAEALAKLTDSLYSDSKPNTATDLLFRLRIDSDSDSIRPGLHNLLLILKRGVEADADGKLGLQSWTDSQIQAVYSLAYAVVSSSRSLSVEQAEAIIVATVQLSLEFAVCYLERSDFGSADMSIQILKINKHSAALLNGRQSQFGQVIGSHVKDELKNSNLF